MALVLCALLRTLCMTREPNVYDEGLVLTGAMRVAAGEVPHRDFYANYGPGQFYVLAGLFKLFGPSILIARAWDTLVRAATAATVYLLVCRLGSPREAAIAAGLVSIWLGALGFEGFPIFPVLLLAFAAAVCLLPLFEGRPARRWVFAAGLSAGAATLFRYDAGFYLTIAEGLAVSGYGLARDEPLRRRLRALALDLACLAAGIALVCAPVALAYAVSGALTGFDADVLGYGSRLYWRMRALPFPGPATLVADPKELAIYTPVIVWLIAGLAILRMRPPRSTPRTWLILLLTLMSALFYIKGIVRVSIIHMALSIMPALVVALLLYPLVRAARDRTVHVVAGALGFVGIVLPAIGVIRVCLTNVRGTVAWAAAPSTWAPASAAIPAHLAPCHPPAHLGRMACFALPDPHAAAIRWVASRTSPDQRIFVGNGRHDVAVANENLFYFLAARRPVTRWSHFDPGLQTSVPVQRQMIEDLRRTKPPFVVLVHDWDKPPTEPNESGRSSGVTLLDDFLRASYVSVQTFGGTTILEPRP